LKLGVIVGVLLLPMLALSYFMINSLRDDMKFAKRELLGIEMNRLVMPVAIGAAAGKLDDATTAALRGEGAALAVELGIKKEFDVALATLLTFGSDTRYAVDSLAELQQSIAGSSNIILDPHAETYYLGSIVTQHASDLLADFVSLWTLSTRALRDEEIGHDEIMLMLLRTGSWQESMERASSSLVAAANSTDEPGAYDSPLATVQEMASHPLHIVRIIAKSEASQLAATLAAAEEFGTSSAHIVGDTTELWNFAAQRFEVLIQARVSEMQLQLYFLLGLSALACLIGVGGAGLMFQSTLKQLDGVKHARDQADAARREAELAAQDVRRVNDEVVRLNAGLAKNIEMLRESQDDNMRKGRMAQLGQLTATVAHELRNPLGAVRTSAFLLERKARGKGLGIEPQLDRINHGVTRCDNIISQLLDFARTKAIQPESIALDEWIAKLVEEEAQGLPEDISIECDLNLGAGAQAFDPARMRRALVNLISNAAEALAGKGDGGAKPGIKSPSIVITTRRTERGIEISVADNGPGIAPENAQKIFEPLFTTKNFGTGLGLPAVQKIMEQHRGGLEVQSSPGQGAVFVAWWPSENSDDLAA
jgi:signal transduction histidine kinase